MQMTQSRRDFLAGLSAASAAGVLGARTAVADEGPPETATIKLAYYSNNCLAPLLVAEDLLYAEGFTEVRYVEAPESFTIPELVARGDCHFANTFAGTLVSHIDNGLPITGLSGVHSGCYELFAHEPYRTISELRGKRVAIQNLNSDGYYYMGIMAAHVGLDPKTDFDWVPSPDNPMKVFAEGKADAFLAFPPEPQELRDRNIGRVIISTVQDKPWSHTPAACCSAAGTSSATTRSRPSVTCVPSSRRPTFAPTSRRRLPNVWSMPGRGTNMRSRPSPRFSTGRGGTTTPRTPCAFTRSFCTRRA
jgi:NitT/TauT family transport system substrate-binding protein